MISKKPRSVWIANFITPLRSLFSTNTQLRPSHMAFFAIAILLLLTIPVVLGSSVSNLAGDKGSSHLLAPSANYTENLAIYLTSGETFWRADFNGGNISVSSLTIPQSVSAFSMTLTHYSNWKPQFELFTTYGFGLLGNTEPSPDGVVLTINTTSQADAQSLANSLDQRFALVFSPASQSSGSYSFFSPMDFITEMHVYFWKLIPSYYGGFANMTSETQFESNDLLYYKLAYTPSAYSISIGALAPLNLASGSFALYTQLGLTQGSHNYSTVASSSTVEIHVYGGLISNASFPFQNYPSNYSASISTSKTSANSTIPNINATLNLSFPTLLAYRQISPSLTPSKDANVSVTITVKDVSPQGAPGATDVKLNDSWIYSQKNNFNLTIGQTSGSENLSSGQSMTVAYAFTVLASNGTFNIPATPVTYQFKNGNNTLTSSVLLNPGTIVIGGQNTPLIEATETLGGGVLQAGQTFSVNITITNKGSGTAFNLNAAGQKKQALPQGSSWSFITNSSTASLTQTNSSVSFPVNWTDPGGQSHSTLTNTMSATFSFGTPATPAVGILKSVELANSSKTANVTLILYNSSPNSVSNLTVNDPLPAGVAFIKSLSNNSLRLSGGLVVGNVSSLAGHANTTLNYLINITDYSQNFIFGPANVSAHWNGGTITHYSAAYVLPLGVVATKQINPSQAFQGSNATILISLKNGGSIPIYNVVLNNTFDQFVNVTKSNSSFSPILNPGSSINASLKANLTGTAGTYNSSTAVASFLIAGYNKSATSAPYVLTIYHLVEANFSSTALKFEENHNINVTVTVYNPSNVTVNNVVFSLHLPSGLNLVSNTQPNFTISTLGPDSNKSNSFVVITNQPNVYRLSNASLYFQYQGVTLKGLANSFTLTLQDDITLRYGIPILVAIIIALATLFFARRLSKGGSTSSTNRT